MKTFKLMLILLGLQSNIILCGGRKGLSQNERDASALAQKVAARGADKHRKRDNLVNAERRRLLKRKGGGSAPDKSDLIVVQKAVHRAPERIEQPLTRQEWEERGARKRRLAAQAVRNKQLYEERVARMAIRDTMALALLMDPDAALPLLREQVPY